MSDAPPDAEIAELRAANDAFAMKHVVIVGGGRPAALWPPA